MSADNAKRDSATTAHGLPFTPSLSPSLSLAHSICLFFSIFHLYLCAFISIRFCSDPTPNLLCNLLRVLSTIIDSFLRFAYAKANLQYIYLHLLPPSHCHPTHHYPNCCSSSELRAMSPRHNGSQLRQGWLSECQVAGVLRRCRSFNLRQQPQDVILSVSLLQAAAAAAAAAWRALLLLLSSLMKQKQTS